MSVLIAMLFFGMLKESGMKVGVEVGKLYTITAVEEVK
jgi:hypothetical protein